MCEIIVQTVDLVCPENAHIDVKLLKRGDVIEVCDDGWQWTDTEINHPNWRLLKFPGVSKEEVTLLLYPEIDVKPWGVIGENPMLQIRGFYLDLDMHPQDDIHAMTKRREPRDDPSVIGK